MQNVSEMVNMFVISTKVSLRDFFDQKKKNQTNKQKNNRKRLVFI